jgi:hypothetical protein
MKNVIKVDDHFLKPYEYGWELHQAYDGYTKIDGLKQPCIKHRVTYWPNLKHACIALSDLLNRKSAGEPDILSAIRHNTDRIIAAIEGR